MSAPESAVRYFIPGSKLPRGLRGKLQSRLTEHMGFIASGAAEDFADYRYRAGQIQALSEAIEICEQMEKDEER